MFDLDRWNEIWETIVRNKKRSIMTAMGVFWGIFMLVILLGGGLGLGNMMISQMGGMSTNTAFMFTEQTSVPYKGMPKGRWWNFDSKDIEDIEKQVPGIRYAAGMNWGGNVNFSYKDRKGEYFLMGYTPDFIHILPQNIRFGRYINEIDMREKRKVCTIGTQIWKELFPGGENPVGETIVMNGMYLTIIGVLDRGTTMINFGGDPEYTVSVPTTLVQQLYNRGNRIDMIVVTADDKVNVNKVQKQCEEIIAANHLISPDDAKAIDGFNLSDEFERINGLFRGINLLTWIVGLGTLLAGIVGVSNIMLVIVRERTQEIGVRRALGAPPRSIISQILSESFVLTFIAGILGLALAVGVLSVVDNIVARNPEGIEMSFQISFWMGMLAAGIIIMGSLLAGLIPANRALKIKAVDAIREE